MDIQDYYVSFEIAKLLKERGFDEMCQKVYMHNGQLLWAQLFMEGESFVNNKSIKLVADYNDWITDTQGDYAYLCPTLYMTLTWLRKAHNIYIYATPWYHEEENPLKKGEYNPVFDGWGYNISNLTTNAVIAESDEDNLYSTPEQACEIAIKYYLEKFFE